MEGQHHTRNTSLDRLDPLDKDLLLTIDPELRLGVIMQLNREPRYNFSLDAIALLSSMGPGVVHGASFPGGLANA
jgi:hypothetical protein